jgi:mono/diheme cytochrome c family protein
LGRIYRVVHDTTKRDLRRFSSNVRTFEGSKVPLTELVDTLSHPNGWWRDTAQRLLVERLQGQPKATAKEIAAARETLTRLALSHADWRTRLHALWTLDGIDAISPKAVLAALDDGSPHMRSAAIRIAERWMAEPAHAVHAAVAAKVDDPHWAVRQQLAASAGALPADVRAPIITSLLERHGGDPVTVDAALSSIRGLEPDILANVMAGDRTAPREAAITMLAATIVRSAQHAATQDVLAAVSDATRPEWLRSALLRGAEVALLGASMPGGAAVRRAALTSVDGKPLPCPTCPGGRAGPGGAYAFSRPQDSGASGGRGRGGGRLRLSAEPAAFAALAGGSGDLAARAKELLARVTWPGKPGEAAPVAPLTAEEQRRFDAGRDVYRNLCQACHQPDGRGQDRLAPSLIESPLALATPEIPARILLHGKEGRIGLMPPIGAAITDEQIASVLTYIRREWGQEGTPVDPATVKTVRTQTSSRTRPWTDEELTKLTQPGR